MNTIPIMEKIIPPERGIEDWIKSQGRQKHGWWWLQCASGDWLGSREGVDHILQVKPNQTGVPARKWSRTFADGYVTTDEWKSLDDFITRTPGRL